MKGGGTSSYGQPLHGAVCMYRAEQSISLEPDRSNSALSHLTLVGLAASLTKWTINVQLLGWNEGKNSSEEAHCHSEDLRTSSLYLGPNHPEKSS